MIDGKKVDPKSQHHIEHGGTVLIRTPAGGGYGQPGKRIRMQDLPDLTGNPGDGIGFATLNLVGNGTGTRST